MTSDLGSLPRSARAVRDTPLVLSLFPGLGLLDMAFEEAGFCVVRGPDLLWGGDIRRFHVPAGRFDGVIGGPPCKAFSALVHIVRAVHGEGSVAENLIPEFERVVREAAPKWFVMENVPRAPMPRHEAYHIRDTILNNRWLGEDQNRVRRFSWGTAISLGMSRMLSIETAALESPRWEPAVCSTAGGRRASVAIGGSGKSKGNQKRGAGGLLRNRTVAEGCVLQGLPADFLADSPLTVQGKREAIGNGVPLPMGRAIAKAVKRAMYPELCEAAS
jgi:DNA (cytosine-5)-methyltransferase 1